MTDTTFVICQTNDLFEYRVNEYQPEKLLLIHQHFLSNEAKSTEKKKTTIIQILPDENKRIKNKISYPVQKNKINKIFAEDDYSN